MEPERDEITGKMTTGHVWDGIKELNTPMPRFVKALYWLSIIFAVGYWILMPAWPYVSDYTRGILGYQQRSVVTNRLAEAKAERAPWENQIIAMAYSDIQDSAELHGLALASGEALFDDNCLVCHRAGATGQVRFPNLTDNDWLWGGTIEAIEETIRVGINTAHKDTRAGGMPAHGTDQILDREQIKDVIEHVRLLSGAEHDSSRAARGGTLFTENCASCHGDEGRGDYDTGAPNLTDATWLFGGDRETLWQTIFFGRVGVMPHWNERLDDAAIKALTLYVYSLGGGEPSKR